MFELIVYRLDKEKTVFRGRYDDLDQLLTTMIPFASPNYSMYVSCREEKV